MKMSVLNTKQINSIKNSPSYPRVKDLVTTLIYGINEVVRPLWKDYDVYFDRAVQAVKETSVFFLEEYSITEFEDRFLSWLREFEIYAIFYEGEINSYSLNLHRIYYLSEIAKNMDDLPF